VNAQPSSFFTFVVGPPRKNWVKVWGGGWLMQGIVFKLCHQSQEEKKSFFPSLRLMPLLFIFIFIFKLVI